MAQLRTNKHYTVANLLQFCCKLSYQKLKTFDFTGLLDDCSNTTRMCLLFSALSSIVRHHQHLYPISIMHRSALFSIIISKFVAFLLQIRYFVATYRLDQSHDSFLKIIMFFDKCSIDSLFLPSVTSAYIFIVVLISE